MGSLAKTRAFPFLGKGLERHDSNGDGWYVLRDYSDPCALCLLTRSVLGTALMRCCHLLFCRIYNIDEEAEAQEG